MYLRPIFGRKIPGGFLAKAKPKFPHAPSLTVLEPHVLTKGDTGRTVLTVPGMVAEMERGFIKFRQRYGIAKAKEAEVCTGGKRRIGADSARSLRTEARERQRLPRRWGSAGCKPTAS